MKSQKFFSWVKVILFSAVLVAVCVWGFILPLRPTESEEEKRTLTEFPDFTLDSFLSGEYTEQISLWYSDTFPAREKLLRMNDFVRSLYGIGGESISSGNQVGEVIDTGETFVWETNPPEEPGSEQGDTDTETETVKLPEGDVGEIMDQYYVVGDRGYELYSFNRDMSLRYARLVTTTAQRLDGKAQVYVMVVPLSYCFGLTEDVQAKIGVSNGEEAIAFMYRAIEAYGQQAGLTSPPIPVNICDTMRAHYDEYIYFRTDHHWTAKGAYYASRVLLDTVGRPYPALEEYDMYEIHEFRGSLYTHTRSEAMYRNPDTIFAYASRVVDHVTITTREGEVLECPLVDPDAETLFGSFQRYRCFVNGDYPYYVTHNEELHDGSSILIIKESYGNAFIPMLADSYEYVYAVDYRFWRGNIEAFVEEQGVDTVLFLNNLVATGSEYTVGWMERLANR